MIISQTWQKKSFSESVQQHVYSIPGLWAIPRPATQAKEQWMLNDFSSHHMQAVPRERARWKNSA